MAYCSSLRTNGDQWLNRRRTIFREEADRKNERKSVGANGLELVCIRVCVCMCLCVCSLTLTGFSKRSSPPQLLHFRLSRCILESFYPPCLPFKVWIRHMTSRLPLPLPLPLSPLLIEVMLLELVNQAVASCSIPQQLDRQAWPLHCWDLGSPKGQTYTHLLFHYKLDWGDWCLWTMLQLAHMHPLHGYVVVFNSALVNDSGVVVSLLPIQRHEQTIWICVCVCVQIL